MSQPRFPIHPGDEERLAAEMGRELELGDVHGIRPSAGFADRVMAAIADEPAPQPAVMLGLALRRRRLGAALAAIGDSWRVAFGGPRPFAVRAQALALVLVVAVGVVGTGGAAVVGASRLLGLDATPQPSVQPAPVVSPSPSIDASPSPSPSPSPSISPSPSPRPSRRPRRPRRTSRPRHRTNRTTTAAATAPVRTMTVPARGQGRTPRRPRNRTITRPSPPTKTRPGAPVQRSEG